MPDWFDYWNEAPLLRESDPLKQVGKTVNGAPISGEQFRALVRDVQQKLDLVAADVVLDLCCGNGAVTFELAKACSAVVGVDFSAPLIEVARERFQSGRIEYVLADVCDLPAAVKQRPFSKVCMYEGLQHLSPGQADLFLRGLRDLPAPRPTLLLASVPDASRIWNFYDTPQRRADYERRLQAGTEAIGQWWDKDALAALLRSHAYESSFLEQHPLSHGAHYRFDVLCTPSPQGTPG